MGRFRRNGLIRWDKIRSDTNSKTYMLVRLYKMAYKSYIEAHWHSLWTEYFNSQGVVFQTLAVMVYSKICNHFCSEAKDWGQNAPPVPYGRWPITATSVGPGLLPIKISSQGLPTRWKKNTMALKLGITRITRILRPAVSLLAFSHKTWHMLPHNGIICCTMK